MTTNKFIEAQCEQAGEMWKDEDDLSRLIANGTNSWSDVPNATAWVDGMRGAVPDTSAQPVPATVTVVMQQALDALLKSMRFLHDSMDYGMLDGAGAQLDITDKALAALREALAQPVPPARNWIKGVPPHPYDKEWFIAQTEFGRAVLRALPEEYSYDFKTADETYFLATKVKAWMQFPDSRFLDFEQPVPSAPPKGDEQ